MILDTIGTISLARFSADVWRGDPGHCGKAGLQGAQPNGARTADGVGGHRCDSGVRSLKNAALNPEGEKAQRFLLHSSQVL